TKGKDFFEVEIPIGEQAPLLRTSIAHITWPAARRNAKFEKLATMIEEGQSRVGQTQRVPRR
ncbi:MAG TPA: hypothetical protein VFH33_03235, partial [Candidatus Krumholzibacteria bacterium]|nr:hypothetical protein [Candidatus Krumholzibacteria bacterium]